MSLPTCSRNSSRVFQVGQQLVLLVLLLVHHVVEQQLNRS
jgi:hypothetical protein